MAQITRMTLFKLPKSEDQDACLAAYSKMFEEALKDGKPYILTCDARKLHEDPRSNGYTVLGMTTFASLEDMKYYDDSCEAHTALKKNIGPRAGGPTNIMTVYY